MSPEGTAVNSPGRQSWDSESVLAAQSPGGAGDESPIQFAKLPADPVQEKGAFYFARTRLNEFWRNLSPMGSSIPTLNSARSPIPCPLRHLLLSCFDGDAYLLVAPFWMLE